jgi:hypothetical protein
MDRRDFLKYGAIGAAGLTAGSAGVLDGLDPAAAFAAGKPARIGVTGPKAWKFGVMADTQWQKNVDGLNPGTCAVGIINLLNAQFVHHGVKFVVQVGDLIDSETDGANGNPSVRTLPTRALAAEALYDCGIGFYPVRGNHEGSSIAANEFPGLFPQTQGQGKRVFGAGNFSSPAANLAGLSYSFDYENVRFVLIDQFMRTDGSGDPSANTNTIDQLPWIESRIAGRPSGTHAIVLGHKNLVGQDHVDTLFGADPSQNPASRNEFIGKLAGNGVRYYLGGHDHMHHRSLVTSPDGTASVKQVICSSNSYKFYTPAHPLSNDGKYDMPTRELPLAQEAYTVGYYIYTVDGPRVTVDFYSTTPGVAYNLVQNGLAVSPFNTGFFKRETWGYSLNGQEFVIAEGGSYTAVQDTFKGTTAKILSGSNGSTTTDMAVRKLAKGVNTGWSVRPEHVLATSEVLSLWGMADSLALWDNTQSVLLPSAASSTKTDTFTLSMGYADEGFGLGHVRLLGRDAEGRWVDAVDLNTGGTQHFVNGPWNASYGLGTWGVDKHTRTVWAVVNHEGDFVVSRSL